MSYILPELGYSYDALQPHIDARTMEIHHSKHHAAYVKNVNAAIEGAPDLQAKSIESLVANLDAVPENSRSAVRNNGGGHANHSLFWRIMSADGGGDPGGALSNALSTAFSDLGSFKDQFLKSGMTRFGSGWAWLVTDGSGKLSVLSTANQDSPLSQGLSPVLGLDVWEHAYYLNYQNRRGDYIAAWWNVVNWSAVEENYEKALG